MALARNKISRILTGPGKINILILFHTPSSPPSEKRPLTFHCPHSWSQVKCAGSCCSYQASVGSLSFWWSLWAAGWGTPVGWDKNTKLQPKKGEREREPWPCSLAAGAARQMVLSSRLHVRPPAAQLLTANICSQCLPGPGAASAWDSPKPPFPWQPSAPIKILSERQDSHIATPDGSRGWHRAPSAQPGRPISQAREWDAVRWETGKNFITWSKASRLSAMVAGLHSGVWATRKTIL